MIALAAAARDSGISRQYLADMARNGRIPGAKLRQIGKLKYWMLPTRWRVLAAARRKR